ncbi:MAG: alpha-2-macroglobulin [Pirellulales bacterium]|nr:alpha-2-macroglobulin [Pirellulales bacterium]
MKFTLGSAILAAFGFFAGGMTSSEPAAVSEQAARAFSDGNFKDAFELYQKLAFDPDTESWLLTGDLNQGIECLKRLGRVSEIDAFREKAAAVHKDDWRLLRAVAQSYMNVEHQGFMVAGQFERGPHRGGGQWMNATERDRVRALQLMVQALPLVEKEANHGEAAGFYFNLAAMLLGNRGYSEAWRLQTLTDLKVLPDYEPGWGSYRQGTGAPVEPDGKPVFYTVPKGWDAAQCDGQRWRWCLAQAAEMNPRTLNRARFEFAQFLYNQFGVQTMASFGWRFGQMETDESKENESGTYALHTLGENETIARLATGIKRFELPEEFNYIKIYRQIAAEPQTGYALQALETLGGLFENRRQYPRAAEYWRRLLKDYPRENENRRRGWRQRLDQIVGNWGRFEPVSTQPAGRGATVEFRYRNGDEATFTAHEIEVEKLLADVKAYIKTRPKNLNWSKIDIANIGWRLVDQNQTRYRGRQVARWELKLDPPKEHFDKRITVHTPLSKPGAYLVSAKMTGGNENFIVLWIDDTAIVRKPLNGKNYYYVADAVSGAPVARANVEFFGWRQQYFNKPPRHEVLTKQFAEYTDADGQVFLDPKRQPQEYQWLTVARTDQGRFAFLGFSHVWYGNWYDAQYNETKVYVITDRPVYRPEQEAKYKIWVRKAQYDMGDVSEYAGHDFTVEIYNPKGEKIVTEQKKADAYGGLEGIYKLPKEAPLGVYRIQVEEGSHQYGGNQFRVEEYKKPEFEVTVDAPDEPVMLGEKITATIKAKYYFGSPVTKAKVQYKVQRTSYTERWYPIGPWDWLYGPGYWWFAYDYDWYPGWRHWGCCRPIPFWWPHYNAPPELVAEQEVEIGEDGTVKVEIDTAVAKAIHPDQDHSYSITAEVTDQSRRTIVGQGTVLVARKPFTVTAWVDRGYYRVGDTVAAHFSARTLDGKPVEGKGELKLLKISYKDGKPIETPVQTWKLDTNAEGTAVQQITASRAGQYRLSYSLSLRERAGVRAEDEERTKESSSPHPNPLPEGEGTKSIEGGYVFTIIGEGYDSANFRFNAVEIVPDKREYAPGEKVKLQINTDREDGTVLLFLRPANGVYLPPKILRLHGKSAIVETEVTQKDMPNFFVEAVTVADGRINTEAKEIVVPPEKRVLNVEIQPSAESYKPGEKAKVKLKLTDFFGKPFVGTTVVSIYDKSVEYISGGSNVPEIKAFFWKWRRRHHPRTEDSLARRSSMLVRRGVQAMQDLGVFGQTVVEEVRERIAGARSDEAFTSQIGIPYPSGGMNAGAMVYRGAGQRIKTEAALPLEKPAPPAAFAADGVAGKGPASGIPPPGGAPLVQPTVRTKFADTALWVGALETDQDGTAEVALDMPENLTTWRIKVWGLGQGTRVGQGQTDVITRKDLIIRMEAPRFFVQTDEVVLSAIVHNYLKTEKTVKVLLELEGQCLELQQNIFKAGHINPDGTSYIEPMLMSVPTDYVIPANGETRVDWRVKVLDEGEAVIRMKALTDEDSDAMEQRFPCYIHGMFKTESYSGALRSTSPLPSGEGLGVRAGSQRNAPHPNPLPKGEGTITFTIPEKRQPEHSRVEVRYSPTLAGAMVDALPYLVDYPYGCTEQTLNRFLPTVITQKILLDMHLDLKEIEKKRSNLNAQEIGEDAERAKQWKHLKENGPHPSPLPEGEGTANPVFDVEEVQAMVKDGVERLTEMQCSDGGWGWFSGWAERSMPHTTAVVVHGLQVARQNDVALVPGVLERGVEWLKRYQDEQVQLLKNAAIKDKPEGLRWKRHADNLDAFVYMVLTDAGVKNPEMHEFLYRDRTKLAVYGMALYGLAVEKLGDKEKLAMIMQNIGQYVEQDDENQTAWLHLPNNYWWCWYGSEYEAHAYYLKLLAKTDPKGELASRIVKYLLNNRKHTTYWNSTRDTALCLEAFADFLRASGEARPEMTVEVFYDGKLQKAVEISPENLFSFDNKFVLAGDAITAGRHTVTLKRKGTGPLYYNGYVTNFTLEDFITRAGLEIKVDRKYYKLVRMDKTVKAAGSRGQAVDQKVEKYERQEIKNDEVLKSGDLVEIELTIRSKNDYEYLVFEDMKPAGFEPVDVRSGYTGNALGAYVEFRDNRVVFFARTLARGTHSVAYRMRAEIPGKFSALPTRAWAMYAPELKANSDEIKLKVTD